MKRVRLQRWGGQLVGARARPCCVRQQQQVHNAIAASTIQARQASTTGAAGLEADEQLAALDLEDFGSSQLPSPPHQRALSSAKLAALHSRLALPRKLPLQTLSRTLIDPTADPSASFNNQSLGQLGQSLLSFHVTEWLVATYPRLPMAILFSALTAYIGPATLSKIAYEWGVESAAYPGGEVDPGLLQFSKYKSRAQVVQGASVRPDKVPSKFRRGMSSRVVYDDEFGDVMVKDNGTSEQTTEAAYAGFVRALMGSIYLHAGSQAAKDFVTSHILSRHLPMDKLFELKQPTRDLSRLCAREGFEYPVARMLSETGRLSRHPVFVVGIFSGQDKLGEGSGPSLDEARMRAAISALKAWYLYSPTAGKTGRLPSDVENGGAWEPVHIDIGEVV